MPENFVEVVANYAKSARRAAVPVEGQETEASSCRFRIAVEPPMLRQTVVTDLTVHTNTVPLTGEVAKALESCAPTGRMAVRPVSLTEMNLTAPAEMRMEAEVVFDLGVTPGAELAPELFTVTEGWRFDRASARTGGA